MVRELKVKLGDTLSEGSVVALLEAAASEEAAPPPQQDTAQPPRAEPAPPQERTRTVETGTRVEPIVVDAQADNITQASIDKSAVLAGAAATASAGPRFDADAVLPDKVPYASPAVRLFARELGVDLAQVSGSRARRPHHPRGRAALRQGRACRRRRAAAVAARRRRA